MENPNALIAMAQVSQNVNNPFSTFCEYIKYCVHTNTSNTMMLEEVRTAVGQEFGIYLPRNILLKCVSILEKDQAVVCKDFQIKRNGTFDATNFEKFRNEYRQTEDALIQSLIEYAARYNKSWDAEHARRVLIDVLDQRGLAYDIFFNHTTGNYQTELNLSDDYEAFLADDESDNEREDTDNQALYNDSMFVGKFVKDILAGDSSEKHYLTKVCEGLMVCTGAYQIPSSDADMTPSQIRGTFFFFDTKLLLRFIGCAGEATVQSAKELVQLIQSAGGIIYYYPQTLDEMNFAFDDAMRRLSRGYLPKDDEMRSYAVKVRSNIAVISAKKAGLVHELAEAQIHKKPLDLHTERDRIRFDFSKDLLAQFMQSKLNWSLRAIENDAISIWETHMRRKGKYDYYCGGRDKLPVFVTTNSRLVWVALKFGEENTSIAAIKGWKSSRLPVITDIRLTCRLWSPSSQGERLSLLYLTANAVAAQRPTQKYINTIRELAAKIKEEVPAYSNITLAEYFDDIVTDTILEHTDGLEENLNIATFASSIAELADLKAKEEQERTNRANRERDQIKEKYDSQKMDIIEGAVEKNKNKLGIGALWLRLILFWPYVVAAILAAVSGLIFYVSGNWNILSVIGISVLLALVQKLFESNFVTKWIVNATMQKLQIMLEKQIAKNLSKAELPYKVEIIDKIWKENSLLLKYKNYFAK